MATDATTLSGYLAGSVPEDIVWLRLGQHTTRLEKYK